MILRLVVCVLVVLQCKSQTSRWRQGEFNYDREDNERGPYAWYKLELEDPNQCNGTRQSPINVKTWAVDHGQDHDGLRYFSRGYDGELDGSFHNDGHTAEFSPRDGEPKLFMKNVPFHENERFVFDQLHFHFGRNIYEGSEHRVNDFAFSGEGVRNGPMDSAASSETAHRKGFASTWTVQVHLKHYNAKYGSIEEAIKHPDGVAAVGIFIQAVDVDDDDDDDEDGGCCFTLYRDQYGRLYRGESRRRLSGKSRRRKKPKRRRAVTRRRNIYRDMLRRWMTGRELYSSYSFREDIDEFLNEHLPEIVEYDTKVDDVSMNPLSLFPDSQDFYFYYGSLTTPPCTENIMWILFRNPISLSKETFLKLRRLKTRHEYRMGKFGIYRPIQPLNNRRVWSNF